MATRLRRRLLFGLALAAGHAAGSAVPTVALSALDNDHPQRCAPIPWSALVADAEVLKVTVVEVDNPHLRPITIALALATASRQYEVARFTLYPPDQPGTFRFRLDETARKLLASPPPPRFCALLAEQPEGKDDKVAARRVRLAEPRFERAD